MNKTQVTDLQIIKYFKNDVLDLKKYPKSEVAEYYQETYKRDIIIDTSVIENTELREEFKNFIKCIFINNVPYTYKMKNCSYIIQLPEFLNQTGIESILDLNPTLDTAELITYYDSKNLHCERMIKPIISTMQDTIVEFYDKREGLDRDVWRQEMLNLPEERLDKSKTIQNINFRKITHKENRELIKKWMKYMIAVSQAAYSTICNYYSRMYLFVTYIGDTSILDVKHELIENFLTDTLSNKSDNYRNHACSTIKSLYQYLSVNGIFNGDMPILDSDFVAETITYKKNTVADEVIFQIFRHLDKLEEKYRLMYLIDCFSALRVSDICQLKVGCAISMDGRHYLQNSCQKMQKFTGIPISAVLYDMIIDWAKKLVKNNPNQIYLFDAPRKKNSCVRTNTYMKHMKAFMEEFNIKNPDGTPYNFTSHTYRHTFATLCKNECDMTLEQIQIGVLKHRNLNMSKFYVEYSEEDIREAAKTYLSTSDEIKISEVKVTDNVLSNGYCCRPAIFGNCPSNICLDCPDFRTSIEFLDVHKKQLANLEEKIEYYTLNGYKNNLYTANIQREKLLLLISKLEEGVDVNE